jgi:RNA polymerase sigma factor (sigma-70 family)
MAAQPDSRPSRHQRERNTQLLCKVLARDEQRLRRHARRHAELPDDTDDALQSAYALFLERYNGFGEPLAWLYTTVKREAWAIRRRTSRRRECSFTAQAGDGLERDLSQVLPVEAPGPDERTSRDELLAERRQALAELKPDERQALWLLGLGFSYAEICEATGWTYTKVNRCLSEGRAALRQPTELREQSLRSRLLRRRRNTFVLDRRDVGRQRNLD